MVGGEWAGYQLRAVLGRGGMSVVYKAEHPRLGSTVALKVLAPDLATDDVFRARFLEESRIAAALHHPNVIPIYDMGPCEDLLYIAMHYVPGADLRAVLSTQGVLAPDQALLLIAQTGRALDAAHRHGLVHRDVKPGNILIERGADFDEPDHAYLADFGITKHTVSRSGLTPTGQLVGTIDYVAPEQIQGEPVDGRADIYSLGCVLYESLTGSVPFPKDLDAAVILAHIEELPVAPSTLRPELPPAIDDVLDRVLAKEPGHRYQTCRELLSAAHAALPGLASQPHTVLTRRPEPLAGGATTHPGSSGRRSGSGPGGRAGQAGAGTGPTQGGRVSQPRSAPDGGAAGGAGDPGGGPPGGSPWPRRRTGSAARWLAAAAVVVLALGGGIGAWVATHSGSSVPAVRAAARSSAPAAAPSMSPTGSSMMHSQLMQALVVANESVTAKGMLPPASCHPQSSAMVTCTRPALGISTVSFRTYPSLGALYSAYVADIRRLSGGQFRQDFGDCTEDQVNGEVGWNHDYQHPRNYSVRQMASGSVSDDKAAGRVFCTFMNDQLYLVWTQDDGHLLAMLNGAPHENAWVWWRGIHHSIDLGGMSMHM
jgi:serine/threonine-protein kinase